MLPARPEHALRMGVLPVRERATALQQAVRALQPHMPEGRILPADEPPPMQVPHRAWEGGGGGQPGSQGASVVCVSGTDGIPTDAETGQPMNIPHAVGTEVRSEAGLGRARVPPPDSAFFQNSRKQHPLLLCQGRCSGKGGEGGKPLHRDAPGTAGKCGPHPNAAGTGNNGSLVGHKSE